MKTALSFVAILLLAFTSCKKNRDYEALLDATDNDIPIITTVSVYDTLPKNALVQLDLRQTHGIKAEHGSGRYTCYFAYQTDATELLRRISALPFRRGQHADTLCRQMPQPFSLSGQKLLSEHEQRSSAFFWPSDPEGYTHYECVKGNQRHTILISKVDDTVLHRIEGRI
jgi:hypothetical protein